MMVLHIRYIWLYLIFVNLSDDNGENSGPKPTPCQSFSICLWNINSVSSQSFSKISLPRTYNSIDRFDVIFIFETFLNSDTTFNDDNLKSEGYNIVRSDHLSNSRKSGACIYYKPFTLKILDIKYLQEGIIVQVLIENNLCNFISVYRSPSQPTDSFDEIVDSLELTLDEVAYHKPFLIPVLGNFNVKSEN